MPLFWLSLAFLTSLALSEELSFAWWSWAGLVPLCLGMAFMEKGLVARRSAVYQRLRAFLRLPIAVILAFLMLGGSRAKSTEILNFAHHLWDKIEHKSPL